MFLIIQPVLKDPIRVLGRVEREIVYYKYDKMCPVCNMVIKWDDLEVHHIEDHAHGGRTDLDNNIAVHKDCHPKGKNELVYNEDWFKKYINKENTANEQFVIVEDGIIKALGNYLENKFFLVKEKSKASRIITDKLPSTYKELRLKLVNDLILKENGDNLEFTKDFVFNSSSAAASIIRGFSESGPRAWQPLNEFIQKQENTN